MTATDNPITRRVAMLSNQWLEFATDDRARMLCWQLASDEARMLEAFFAMETDARTASHSDLFIPLESPFESGPGHAEVLHQELVGQFERDRDALAAEGLPADWEPPSTTEAEPDLAFFVRSCESFREHHALPRHLVLVLQPGRLSDGGLYQQWLLQLALKLPPNLRVIAVDTVPPAYATLLEHEGPEVVARAAQLDMPAAFADISQNAGKLDTPGGQYRELFLQLGKALGQNDLARAQQLVESAVAVASAQGWFHMHVPVRAALGGALAADGRIPEAKAQYLAAEASALRGQSEGDPTIRPVCAKLRLQSRLGLGSALIAGEEFRDAAVVFEETLPLAAASGDDAMRLDCYRLASFCYERAEDPETAYRWALEGLHAAQSMPRETLATSTFPYLGEALLRLCEQTEREAQKGELERVIASLTGDKPSEPSPEPSLRPT